MKFVNDISNRENISPFSVYSQALPSILVQCATEKQYNLFLCNSGEMATVGMAFMRCGRFIVNGVLNAKKLPHSR